MSTMGDRCMTTEPKYTGTLKPPSPGSPALAFEIADAWGWVISVRGEWDGKAGHYVLKGQLGPTPPSLLVAGVDG